MLHKSLFTSEKQHEVKKTARLGAEGEGAEDVAEVKFDNNRFLDASGRQQVER